jgi:hypothetical protein
MNTIKKEEEGSQRDLDLALLKMTILEVFEKKMGNVQKTCQACKIGRTTFYNYKNEDPDFKQAVEDIKEGLIDTAEDKLREKIEGVPKLDDEKNVIPGEYTKEPETTAIIFYLKTVGRSRGYIERVDNFHHNMTPEQMAEALRKQDSENE